MSVNIIDIYYKYTNIIPKVMDKLDVIIDITTGCSCAYMAYKNPDSMLSILTKYVIPITYKYIVNNYLDKHVFHTSIFTNIVNSEMYMSFTTSNKIHSKLLNYYLRYYQFKLMAMLTKLAIYTLTLTPIYYNLFGNHFNRHVIAIKFIQKIKNDFNNGRTNIVCNIFGYDVGYLINKYLRRNDNKILPVYSHLNKCSHAYFTTDTCSICYETLDTEKQLYRVLLDCGHCFHTNCVDPWISIHKNCPYCRKNIE